MKTILVVTFIWVALLASPICSFSFDGPNWNRLSVYEKEAYLAGFNDGFALQKLYGDRYAEYISWKYSYFEIARGLDKFYSDNKNANFEVGEALIIYNAGVKGLSDKEIEEIKTSLKTIRGK